MRIALPFAIVGLPGAAVEETKERVRSAIRNSGFPFPKTRITVNLAPAGITGRSGLTARQENDGMTIGSTRRTGRAYAKDRRESNREEDLTRDGGRN